MINATANVPAACLSAFMASALNQTNYYRAKHGVGALTEDSTIRSTSQAWANYLSDNNLFQHNTAKLPTLGYGENLAMNYASGSASTLTAAACSKSASDAIDMWYNEVKDYNFQTGGFSMSTGHFTQLVWKSTTKVGHGVAFSVDPNYPSFTKMILCADYQAAGNMQGAYQANVFPSNGASSSSAPVTSTSKIASTSQAVSTAGFTTKASNPGSSTAVTTDVEAKAALAKLGTTVLLIWNSNCGISKSVKTAFDSFASKYTNLNYLTADINTFNGAMWAIMSSTVFKYSDYSVNGRLAPPTMLAYKAGIRSVAPVSLLYTAYASLTPSTEAFIKSAGGVLSG